MLLKKKVLGLSILAALSSVALVGCGGSSDSTDPVAGPTGVDNSQVDTQALAMFQEVASGNSMDIDPVMSASLVPGAAQVTGKNYVAPVGSSLVNTTYAGAFDPAAATQWTEGWTIGIHGNDTVWAPATSGTLAGATPAANGACPAGTTDVGDQTLPNAGGTMDICELPLLTTTDLTLTNDNVYSLKAGNSLTYIGNGYQAGMTAATATAATLTIEPGTLIAGGSGSALVISRNSNINAVGTAVDPIVMTSSEQLNSWAAGGTGVGAHGGWGGLVIHGFGITNNERCNNATTCDAVGEGFSGNYGGADNADNSGTLEYVVVRNAGESVGADDELNIISLYTVGSGTTFNHVQAHMGQDDGIEFFGGDMNGSHIVITDAKDDSLDWAQGYTGELQFLVTKLNTDVGDKSMEADNEPRGHDSLPRSNPDIANFTMWGFGDTTSGKGNGMNIRVGAAATLSNGIVGNFESNCLDVDDAATMAHGELSITNTFFYCPLASSAIKQDGK